MVLKIGDNFEALTMHKFPKAVSVMMSKEGIFSMHLRYLSQEERKKIAHLFEYEK